jgi:membrane protein
MHWRSVGELLKETFAEWNKDKASRLAAALAYYTIFSIAPLLMIAIAVAGAVFGEEAARGEIVAQIEGLVGEAGAKVVQTALANVNQTGTGIVGTFIGIATLLLGATGIFGEMQDALNTIWEVAPKPGQGIWALLRRRLISFSMVLGIGFLLLLSLFLSTALAAFSSFMNSWLPGLATGLSILNFLISFSLMTLLFAMIYVVLPDVKIAWKDVLVGAATTAFLFTIGRTLLSIYLGSAAISSTFGAASSLAVLLVWIYYSAQVFFLGAEFTQVYARKYGSEIVPTANAISVANRLPSKNELTTPARDRPRRRSGFLTTIRGWLGWQQRR